MAQKSDAQRIWCRRVDPSLMGWFGLKLWHALPWGLGHSRTRLGAEMRIREALYCNMLPNAMTGKFAA